MLLLVLVMMLMLMNVVFRSEDAPKPKDEQNSRAASTACDVATHNSEVRRFFFKAEGFYEKESSPIGIYRSNVVHDLAGYFDPDGRPATR